MKKYLYLTAISLLLFSCQQDEELTTGNPRPETPSQGIIQEGHIRVKLNPEAAEQLLISTTKQGAVTTGISALDSVNLSLGTYRLQRTFRPAGKYEARHRKAGLHLWYDVYFDRTVNTRSATNELRNIPGIDIVENVEKPRSSGVIPLPAYAQVIRQLTAISFQAATQALTKSGEETTGLPFNDPRLKEQWHYHNDGSLNGSIAGADINLYEAWKYETGSSNVIVAVIDEGVQYSHPDLTDNMWVNTAEKDGLDNTDDDNNGYTDDKYGYNFVSNTGNVTPMTHGTHVAGTIAATNGNGIGVCGIAGGNGEIPGVRIMACQIIDETTNGGNTPESFVYAADNGAVIAQCSWTQGNTLYAAVKEAIDYFIENAGYGPTGEQTGPMAGGLVIFAAANDNTDREAYPAAYEKVLTVSAIGADFTKASYSNYGNWVNIAAPGGEQMYGNEYAILSTDKNSSYSWLQGTSMACPHVSGIAALTLSKFQSPGFTAEDLKERLLLSVHDIDQYNPKYTGKLGIGYIDAGMAVKPQGDPIPPQASELRIIAAFDHYAIVEWNVAEDQDDGHASSYTLAWEAVNGAASEKGGERTYDLRFARTNDLVRDTITGLKIGTTYKFSLTGYDRWKNASETTEAEQEIVRNNAPILTRMWTGNAVVEENGVLELLYNLTEPDGHAVSVKVTPETDWITTVLTDDRLSVKLSPPYGQYTQGFTTVTLSATDQFGASTKLEIPFKVKRKEIAPQLLSPIADQTLNQLYKETVLTLSDYFREAHGEPMMFEVQNSHSEICFAQSNGKTLTLRPQKAGYTVVTIRASNNSGLSNGCSFRINVNPQ